MGNASGAKKEANPGISKEEQALKDAFKAFDKNGDGTVSSNELQMVLKDLGFELNKEEIGDIMSEVDENKDDRISYKEFAKAEGGKFTEIRDACKKRVSENWSFVKDHHKSLMGIESALMLSSRAFLVKGIAMACARGSLFESVDDLMLSAVLMYTEQKFSKLLNPSLTKKAEIVALDALEAIAECLALCAPVLMLHSLVELSSKVVGFLATTSVFGFFFTPFITVYDSVGGFINDSWALTVLKTVLASSLPYLLVLLMMRDDILDWKRFVRKLLSMSRKRPAKTE